MNMTDPLTILIAARNAAATIERAVRSALADGDCALLLVDDQCTDDTVERARRLAGARLRVVRTAAPGGVPVARQAALDAVHTEYAAWLDADDEWLPGRAARLTAALQGGHEVAVEAIDLHDGPTGRLVRRMTVPGFLRRPGGALRLFERNFLPGDTQVAFRVAAFRAAGGYDPAVYGVESFDLLLRVAMAGGRFWYGDEVGYRMYAYPGSVSRNLSRQRAALAAALRKHDYAQVVAQFEAAGFAPRVAAWAAVSMALFREEPKEALAWLDRASPESTPMDEMLEADGPWPFREGWRRSFQRGTILLLAGGCDAAAAVSLRRAEGLEPTAEGANNLGVALGRLGRREEAIWFFEAARNRFPGYFDAVTNRDAETPAQITTHPLRRLASRSEYPGADADRPTGITVPPVKIVQGLPLPPAELQYHVFSRIVTDEEFLEAGKCCAESLEAALARVGTRTADFSKVLDFGCGCARVLRHFSPLSARVELHGTDVAKTVIDWDRTNIPRMCFHHNGPVPPLDFADRSLDYLWSISVFSHLPEDMALKWLEELRRILRPGGIALLTVHGQFRLDEDIANGYLKPEVLVAYRNNGFAYTEVYRDAVLPEWYQNAYMTEAYARRTYGRFFEVLDYLPRGMMGRQDIVLLRRVLGE